MATLEAVTEELKDLRYLSEVDLESSFERNDALLSVVEKNDEMLIVLRDIETLLMDVFNRVPEAIVSGIDKTLVQVTDTFTDTIRFTQTEERRDETGTVPVSGGSSSGDGDKGFFASNFEKGRKDAENFKMKQLGPIGAVVDTVAEVVQSIAAATYLMGQFRSKLSRVATSLSRLGKFLLRRIPILSGLVSLFSDIDDIMNSDSTSFEKFKLALASFSSGFLLPFTGLLDLVMSIAGSIAGAMGFEDAEKTLKSFDAKEAADTLGKAAVDALDSIVKAILGTLSGITADVLEFFGFNSLAASLRGTEEEYLTDNALLEDNSQFGGSVAQQAEATQALINSGAATTEVTQEQKVDAEGALRSAIDKGAYVPATGGFFGSSRGRITSKVGDATKPELEAILVQQSLGEHERLHVEKLLIEKGGTVSILPTNTLEASMATHTSNNNSSNNNSSATKTSTAIAPVVASMGSTPMTMLDAPVYQTPSAQAANNFESYTSNMAYQQSRLDNSRVDQNSGGSVAMVNAPSTTNVSNNTTQYQGGSIVVSNPVDNTVSNYRR